MTQRSGCAHFDAKVDRGAASSRSLPAPAIHLVRQLPSTVKRPPGVVDSARWRAKRRHDGIADVLLERATMIKDDARDALVKLGQQLHRGLGPERFAETRESPDVSEEHGHRLAPGRHARRPRARERIDDVRREVLGEAGSREVIGHLPSQQAPRAGHGSRQHRCEERQQNRLSAPRSIAHIMRLQVELERSCRTQPGHADERAVGRDRAG